MNLVKILESAKCVTICCLIFNQRIRNRNEIELLLLPKKRRYFIWIYVYLFRVEEHTYYLAKRMHE